MSLEIVCRTEWYSVSTPVGLHNPTYKNNSYEVVVTRFIGSGQPEAASDRMNAVTSNGASTIRAWAFLDPVAAVLPSLSGSRVFHGGRGAVLDGPVKAARRGVQRGHVDARRAPDRPLTEPNPA